MNNIKEILEQIENLKKVDASSEERCNDLLNCSLSAVNDFIRDYKVSSVERDLFSDTDSFIYDIINYVKNVYSDECVIDTCFQFAYFFSVLFMYLQIKNNQVVNFENAFSIIEEYCEDINDIETDLSNIEDYEKVADIFNWDFYMDYIGKVQDYLVEIYYYTTPEMLKSALKGVVIIGSIIGQIAAENYQ